MAQMTTAEATLATAIGIAVGNTLEAVVGALLLRLVGFRASLDRARDLATHATELDPQFGFAWERVAELEFSFGRTDRAMDALDTSLSLVPRDAQALALKGFLLAAQNRAAMAIVWFDQALAVVQPHRSRRPSSTSFWIASATRRSASSRSCAPRRAWA